LEEMARRLFEEWFVAFRFPGHDTTPLQDTPHGPLPQGWRWATLGDMLETLEAGTRPKGGIKDGEGEVPSIGAENVNGLGQYDYGKEKLVPSGFFAAMRRGVVRHGDVLLYKDGAHIGRLGMIGQGFPHAECAVNEHVFVLRPKPPVGHQYLYFWLAQSKMQQKIRGLNANAAQPGLNQPAVRSLPLLLPDAKLLGAFADQVATMLDLLFTLAKANRRLGLSRDLLLPRLISGELTVADAERTLETAA
jgi:type I restriction enzyme S subunit